VHANFVGEQDRLAGLAGQAAGVWLRAGFQIWSSGLLACWQRSVVMAVELGARNTKDRAI
jgi:hypothetical protein